MNITSRGKNKMGNVFVLLGVLIAVIWAFSPFYWAIISSFKLPEDTFTISYIPFFQFKPTLQNWINEINFRGREIWNGIKNSIIVSISASLLAIFLGTMAGYALARFNFQKMKNKDIAVFFLSQRILPPVVMVIPFFLIMKSLKLLDTRLALILINTIFSLPFAVLIMRSIFKELPAELEEAALVDGCSRYSAFLRVLLPLAVPGLVATALICLAFTWNEFLFALVLTYKKAVTMPIVIAGTAHTRGVDFWYVATRSLFAIIPPTVIAIALQKFIVRGLTFGAVKG